MAPSKRVLFIVGDYVEDYEVFVPFQALQGYGFEVDAACPGKTEHDSVKTAVHDFLPGEQTYSETRGHNFPLNLSWEEVDPNDYDGLVIPGGRSPEYLSVDDKVTAVISAFFEKNKPVGSIGHGQLILAASGVLKGKKCTAYPACKQAVVASGASWLAPDPISASFHDGNLVTAAAWPGHPEFLGLFLLAMGASVSGADKKVLFLVGDYVEDLEVMAPFQALQGLSYRVDAVCPGKKAGDICRTAVHDFEGDQTYTEKPGHNFTLNASFDAVDVDEFDALLIPGGRSPEYLSINPKVIELVQKFEAGGKVIASICHGQLILAAAGVLKGKKCTAYPAVKPVVVAAGAEWLEPEPVSKCFTDGKLVTGAAWPGHPQFIAQLMAALGSKVAV